MLFFEFAPAGVAAGTHLNLALWALFVESYQGFTFIISGSPYAAISQAESKTCLSGWFRLFVFLR